MSDNPLRDWTKPNATVYDGETRTEWRLTGALRWSGSELEQEWISYRGTRAWRIVPTLGANDKAGQWLDKTWKVVDQPSQD
jgi:hypothetical protein